MTRSNILLILACVICSVGAFQLRGFIDRIGHGPPVSTDVDFNQSFVSNRVEIAAAFVSGNDLKCLDKFLPTATPTRPRPHQPFDDDIYLLVRCRPKEIVGSLWQMTAEVVKPDVLRSQVVTLVTGHVQTPDDSVYAIDKILPYDIGSVYPGGCITSRVDILRSKPELKIISLGAK